MVTDPLCRGDRGLELQCRKCCPRGGVCVCGGHFTSGSGSHVPAFPSVDPQNLGTPGSAPSHPGGTSRLLDMGTSSPNTTTQIHWTP